MACTCAASDAEIIGSAYEQVFVFEMKGQSIWEKLGFAKKSGALDDGAHWTFTFLEQLKGKSDSSQIRFSTSGPCPLSVGEGGGRFVGFLNDTRKPIVGLCNALRLNDDAKKSQAEIEEIRKVVRAPVITLSEEKLRDWKTLAKHKNLLYDKTRLAWTGPEVQVWVLEGERSVADEEPVARYKSKIQKIAIDCKEKTYSLGNEFYFSEPNAAGKLVSASTARKMGAPKIKESADWQYLHNDPRARALYKELCADFEFIK